MRTRGGCWKWTERALPVAPSPFLPFTSEKLNTFFGNENPLFGEGYVEEINDSLGTHNGLKYRGVEGMQWKPSELNPGQELNQPGPLFKKLEESVAEDERARLGK